MEILIKPEKFGDSAKSLILGKQGENDARPIVFDFTAWAYAFGDGVAILVVKRNGDTAPYPVTLSFDGYKALWRVSDVDTAKAGSGSAELKYVVNDVVVKSETFRTYVYDSISENPGPVPDPYESWLSTLVELGSETQIYAQRAETAAARYPYIDPTSKHWIVWDVDAGTYVDTGINAQGDGGGGDDPRVDDILALIPAEVTAENQLADKDFVNSSIATNTANYIADAGKPFESLADLEAYAGDLTNNDYAFVIGTDGDGNTIYTRYKYSAEDAVWNEEYVLNNSSFTSEQWASIQSGITEALVSAVSDHMANNYIHVTASEKASWTNKDEVYVATYGVTTFAAIYEAYSHSRRVIIKYPDSDGDIDVYELTEMQDSSYSVGSRRCYFTKCGHSYEIAYIRLKESDNSWSIGSRQIRNIPSTSGNVGKVLSALNESNEYQWVEMSGGGGGYEEWTLLDNVTTSAVGYALTIPENLNYRRLRILTSRPPSGTDTTQINVATPHLCRMTYGGEESDYENKFSANFTLGQGINYEAWLEPSTSSHNYIQIAKQTVLGTNIGFTSLMRRSQCNYIDYPLVPYQNVGYRGVSIPALPAGVTIWVFAKKH